MKKTIKVSLFCSEEVEEYKRKLIQVGLVLAKGIVYFEAISTRNKCN